jgi:hypothetical protein
VNTVEPKPKALSSSLGAGSVSPKYTPLSNNKTMTTVTFSSGKSDPRQEAGKKYSYDRVKPTSQMNYEESMKKQQQPQVQQEKPLIKYVRSATHITKPEHLSQYTQQKQSNFDIPNREETDPTGPYMDPRQANYTNYPKYTYARPNEQVKQQQMPVGYSVAGGFVSSNNWKGVKSPPNGAMLSSNEIKEKVLQFRSAKIPIVHKVNGDPKAVFMEGKAEQ